MLTTADKIVKGMAKAKELKYTIIRESEREGKKDIAHYQNVYLSNPTEEVLKVISDNHGIIIEDSQYNHEEGEKYSGIQCLVPDSWLITKESYYECNYITKEQRHLQPTNIVMLIPGYQSYIVYRVYGENVISSPERDIRECETILLETSTEFFEGKEGSMIIKN